MGLMSQQDALREQAKAAIVCDNSGNPVSITSDGEVWITETERENNVWLQYFNEFSSDKYVILVSKDNPSWPHKKQGESGERIDVCYLTETIDIAANTEAAVKIGVITRINDTSANIAYFSNLPFLAGVSKEVITRETGISASQIKTDFDDDGNLLHGITNDNGLNIADVNTSVLLDSPVGNIIPALGDIIMFYDHVAGSAMVDIFMFYHNTN